MSQEERRIIHRHWIHEVKHEIHCEVVRISRLQVKARSRLDNARDKYQLRCLVQADVVGMTTTGLARRLNMLRKLQSKVLLCEEAGEVLESHLLTALLPSLEHAILIGDHQQLSPNVANYELSRSNQQGGSQYSLIYHSLKDWWTRERLPRALLWVVVIPTLHLRRSAECIHRLRNWFVVFELGGFSIRVRLFRLSRSHRDAEKTVLVGSSRAGGRVF